MHNEDTNLAELTRLIASHMPGWKAVIDSESKWSTSLVKDGLRFGLSCHSAHDRLEIHSWDWPSYTTMERGELRTNTVWPRDMHEREESISITVSISKGPQKIANDIIRRAVREYRRVWDRCKLVADQRQAYYDNASAKWLAFCSEFKQNEQYNRHYMRGFSVENRDGNLHISGSITLESFRALMNSMGEDKDND